MTTVFLSNNIIFEVQLPANYKMSIFSFFYFSFFRPETSTYFSYSFVIKNIQFNLKKKSFSWLLLIHSSLFFTNKWLLNMTNVNVFVVWLANVIFFFNLLLLYCCVVKAIQKSTRLPSLRSLVFKLFTNPIRSVTDWYD